MKKIKRKEHLKKLIFIEHIIVLALFSITTIFVITKTSARDEELSRNESNYINDSFRNQEPTTGDIFDALYSWTTAYTKNMIWYTENPCIKGNADFIELTWSFENIKVLPQLITDNTIYILSWWKYAVIDQMVFSGNCIAIVGKWDVEFLWKIDKTNAKYSIIDNVSYHNNNIVLPKYTTTTGIEIRIENDTNETLKYLLTWNIETTISWSLMWDDSLNFNINLKNENSENDITTIFYDDSNLSNRIENKIIHDNTLPTITWTIAWTSEIIQNNWLYNTWIKIQISDTNLSWVFNNSLLLSWWIINYDNTFQIEWIYNIIAKDRAGNQTWISFEIDTTPPSTTNLQPSSWSTYTGTSLKLSRQVNENTTRIQSQKYYLYSWTTLITSWEVTPGNTWVTLINIDKWTYNRKFEVTDKAWNISTWSVPKFTFNKVNSIFTGTTAYILWNTGYTNDSPTILFSGNKRFERTIYTGTTWATYFYQSWNYQNIWTTTGITIPRGWWNTGNIKITLWYETEDYESWTGIFNFYIDKTVPNLWLSPLWWRRNSTGNILYTRSWLNKLPWMIKHYTFSMNNNIVYSWTNTSYTQTWIIVNNQYRAQVCAYDIAWNVGCSPVQTIVIDQTPPQIHNVVNSWFYKMIPNPAPIIVDESWEPIYNIIVKRNWTTVLQTWHQTSPYVVNLQWWEALYQIIATDEAGNSSQVNFTIDTTPPTINIIWPSSWLTITWNRTVTFSWTWYDWYFSWYEFVLSGNSFGPFYTGFYTTGSSKTISNLNNWNYQRRITIFDKAWNKTKTDIFPLVLQVPLTWQISLWWIINVSSNNYTKSQNITLETNINNITKATITWSIVWPNGLAIINEQIPAWSRSTPITLTPWEWLKVLYIEFEEPFWYNKIYSQQNVILDTTPPSKPNLTNINNQSYSWTFALSRPISVDDWAWVKEYVYVIEQESSIKKSWTGTSSSITVENMELWLQWTFSIKVKSIDYIWNESQRSESAIFNYSWIPNTSPETFTFSRQVDVQRNSTYRSNSINISWLSSHTLVTASIDEGKLFVNWMDVNKQALVKNWDVLYIELRSSENYFDVTTSTLTISDKAAVFKLITERRDWVNYDDEDENLSSNEIIELEWLYLLIVNLDTNLKTKLKDMLEQKIDELIYEWASPKEIAKLRYIYKRLIEDINNNKDYIYTAPNNKKYTIIHKAWLGYTSINFSQTNQTKYFQTTNEIEEFINKNNPWTSLNYTVDNTRKGGDIITPNWKKYTPFKTTTWKYWSYNMIVPKLFDSLKALQDHLVKNNPKK